jgi:uncharacterized DUF497 family protein
MDFEWNERKRLTNIEKHELDFEDADIVFENPHVVAAARMVAGEERWLATGMIDDVYVTVIYTRRTEVTRIISMRKARKNERRRYEQIFGN